MQKQKHLPALYLNVYIKVLSSVTSEVESYKTKCLQPELWPYEAVMLIKGQWIESVIYYEAFCNLGLYTVNKTDLTYTTYFCTVTNFGYSGSSCQAQHYTVRLGSTFISVQAESHMLHVSILICMLFIGC